LNTHALLGDTAEAIETDSAGFSGGLQAPQNACRPGPIVRGAGDLLPALKPLLESQLGLTLREAEAPVEILMIESVERPTEN
jgi:uncharacterized protein (TIGR03435 family)